MNDKMRNNQKTLKERLMKYYEYINKINELKISMTIKEENLKDLNNRLKETVDSQNNDTGISKIFKIITNKTFNKFSSEQKEINIQIIDLNNQILSIKSELKSLNDEIQQFENVDEEYSKLLSEKEKIILSEDSAVKNELLSLSDKWNIIHQNLKFVIDAEIAGKAFLDELKILIVSLKEAGNFGIYDNKGERAIVTSERHSKIDKAKLNVVLTQKNLLSFQNKLNSIDHKTKELFLNDIGNLATFSEYFYDGFISDWFVQAKIHVSVENAVMVEEKIRRTLHSLDKKRQEMEKELNGIIEKRKKIIEDF